MIGDIRTVIWKEWRELASQTETREQRALIGTITVLLLVVVAALASALGVAMFDTFVPVMFAYVPVIGILGTICDAFAGERERHTLETLLASRLSDETLLTGKIAAYMLYSWGASLLLVSLLLLGANLRHPLQPWYIPSASMSFSLFVLPPLVMLFTSAAGVLFSIRSATVKEAQTRMGLFMVGLFVGMSLAVNGFKLYASRDLARQAMAFVTAPWKLNLTLAAVLLAADVILVAVARARFQRAMLITFR